MRSPIAAACGIATLAFCAVAGLASSLASADNTPTSGARMATRVFEPSAADLTPSACPDASHMVLVEGDYCPEVRQDCKRYLESGGPFAYYRCAEYTSATCLSKARKHMRYCIDRDEYARPGEPLPMSHASWTDAKNVCEKQGKRVCLESEWNFACEGEEMRPYPYGWKRDADACNADRMDLLTPYGRLKDLRVGASDKPRCVSPFGVHNLSGNLEEWTTLDATAGSSYPRPAMKGAFWQPSRNHCRANQTAHDRYYNGTETGFRCCAEATRARADARGWTRPRFARLKRRR